MERPMIACSPEAKLSCVIALVGQGGRTPYYQGCGTERLGSMVWSATSPSGERATEMRRLCGTFDCPRLGHSGCGAAVDKDATCPVISKVCARSSDDHIGVSVAIDVAGSTHAVAEVTCVLRRRIA